MSYNDEPSVTFKGVVLGTLATLVGLVLVVGLFMGSIAGFKAFGRHQAIADANNKAHVARINAANETQVNELRISAQQQKVKITQQEAQIRFEQAKGVREAQDEISRTLTPLYVQFEMVDALKQIAQSGKNNTVVYIPSGANGIPLVSDVNAGKVGLPHGEN
jgi:hypothetical protein